MKNKYIQDLQIRIDSSQEVLKQFWQLHTKLRLNKFMEIPQPFNFFSNIYEEFFKKDMGGVVGAFYNGKLVAGILYINFKILAIINLMPHYQSFCIRGRITI